MQLDTQSQKQVVAFCFHKFRLHFFVEGCTKDQTCWTFSAGSRHFILTRGSWELGALYFCVVCVVVPAVFGLLLSTPPKLFLPVGAFKNGSNGRPAVERWWNGGGRAVAGLSVVCGVGGVGV